VSFVTGTPRPGTEPRDLFADLTGLGLSAPILFVFDSDRVLFASLSPAPPEVIKGRPSMVELLQKHISKVEVVREPIESLFPLVDHRYDHLAMPKTDG
jgi:hypothetical protein